MRGTVARVDMMDAELIVVSNGVGLGVVADAEQGASAIVVAMWAIWLVDVGRVR